MTKVANKGKGNKRIGSILVDMGVISEKDLSNALSSNKASGKKTGEWLVELGLADDYAITVALAEQLSIPLIDLKSLHIPESVTSAVPSEIVKNYCLVPVSIEEGRSITLAMSNPLDFYAVDDVRFATGLRVEVTIAMKVEILDAIARYYPDMDMLNTPGIDGRETLSKLVVFSHSKNETKKSNARDLLKISDAPPIVRFTNAILSDAIKLKASDIHIEPRRDSVMIRYRIDGVMREIMKIERKIHKGIVSRIKVLSSMDISIRKMPQDGKFQVQYNKNHIDIRVSTLPTAYGEKVNMRVLSSVGTPESLEKMGFNSRQLAELQSAISQPQGIVLVTGPTGSGKTTTLYTCLKSLMSPKVNIITLENPIEYELEGINQVEINPKQGLTFATGLRSVLRQDPDIVLLGEIRDAETASIAFRAAQTGHLVLSTLHANSTIETLSRLSDLGLEPFNIASTLNAIVSQRLVRRLCDDCKRKSPIDDISKLKLPQAMRLNPDLRVFEPVGCEACNSTGYIGRIGIHELLIPTAKLKQLMAKNGSTQDIEKAAIESGFVNLTSDGIEKALQGLTSLAEVFRVAPTLSEDQLKVSTLEAAIDTELKSESDSESPTAAEKKTALPKTKHGPISILVVDDDDFMRKLEESILTGEGYAVITAKDGVGALEIIERQIPDLIITDQEMPNMNGVELIHKIKNSPEMSHIPVVMLTDVDELDNEIECLNSGADDYLVKPINARKFIARVSRLIRLTTNHQSKYISRRLRLKL
ncbi:MAG: Flp pilus assembly complex ATPase component TadA [Gammaproteobacteria bacterium]|nr:Flp pilus assembly complex ATPase component TadA [Gammaproteobacteria bacterium]